MGEFLSALCGGVIIALFKRFVLTGAICSWVSRPDDDDDDDGQPSSSTVGAEIHFHH